MNNSLTKLFCFFFDKNDVLFEKNFCVIFRNLPKNVTVMSWNSEVVLAKNRYLGLSSMSHNPNLTEKDLFSFTVIILGTTTEQMNNYEGIL